MTVLASGFNVFAKQVLVSTRLGTVVRIMGLMTSSDLKFFFHGLFTIFITFHYHVTLFSEGSPSLCSYSPVEPLWVCLDRDTSPLLVPHFTGYIFFSASYMLPFPLNSIRFSFFTNSIHFFCG